MFNLSDNSIYQKIFNLGPAAYILVKADSPFFTICDVNEPYLKITHTQREEIIGRGLFEIFPGNIEESGGENFDFLRESLLKVLATMQTDKMSVHRYDLEDKVHGGVIQRYWTAINTPILDKNGAVEYIIHSPLDVTYTYGLFQRDKEAGRALEEQKSNLYSVFMQAPVGIGIFKGPRYHVELINDELCSMLGKPQKAFRGKPFLNCLTEVSGKNFKQILDKVMETGETFIGMEIYMPLVKKVGQDDLYANLAFEPLKEIDGSISGVIAVATNVSTQVNFRRKLEESEQRLNLAIKASNLGIWDTNLITRKSVRSLRHAQIFGYEDTSKEWGLELMFSHVHPGDLERVKQAHLDAFDSGIFNIQFRIVRLDNIIRWIHVIGEIQRDAKGHAIRMLGTANDITEIKEFERLKDEFISTVSHEIKTPVTSVKAYGQLLQQRMKNEGNAENVHFLQKMDLQINRLTSLVHHLLDVTRIESNKLLFKPERFDLNALAKEIVEEIQQLSNRHSIIFKHSGPAMVFADIERLSQVITNMLTNAVKYSPHSNTINVNIEQKESFAILCVEDYGIGIAPQHQQRIFDRFYQADEQANSIPGLGLGLYISSEIIKRQGGKMWVESSFNHGSRFYFKLPLAQ